MGLITGPLRRRARRHFEGLSVLREDEGANSFGVESGGPWQVRGNGTLVLTDDELLFAQWVPNRLLRVPRAAITEVAATDSHLGKRIGRPLLKLTWTTEAGRPDSVAVWVRDLEGWVEALSERPRF